jgi:hypothetical protein
MLRSAIAVFAVAFSFYAHAEPQAPLLSPDDSDATKILKLTAWIGSLDDLSKATGQIPRALGYPLTPRLEYADVDGRHILNWTEYLGDVPIWPSAQSTIQYRVPEAGGPAERTRATVFIRLNPAEACIHMADMLSHFGKPTETYPSTDMGPPYYGWLLRPSPYKTMVSAMFGVGDKNCTPSLIITEAR